MSPTPMSKVELPTKRSLNSSATSPVECKGINITSFLATVERLFPNLTSEQLLEGVDPLFRARVQEEKILVGGWYPVSWYRDLHAALQEVTGSGPDLSLRMGYENTRADFTGNGVYRFVARSLGPGTVLTLGARIFNFYWRPAKMKIVPIGKEKNHGRGRWHGCLGIDQNIWFDLFGSIKAILELSGATDIQLNPLDASDDLSSMLVEARWRVS